MDYLVLYSIIAIKCLPMINCNNIPIQLCSTPCFYCFNLKTYLYNLNKKKLSNLISIK